MKSPEEQWQTDLQSLPPLPPSPAVWQRLARKRKTQLRARAVGIASVMCLVLVFPLALRWQTGSGEGEPTQQTVEAPSATSTSERLADLRAIDRALQAAYDSGASDDEVAPLWAARSALALQPSNNDANSTPSLPQPEKRS